jgi:hypothetical protein
MTEAITYDNDNYITGARVSIRFQKLYFDEISVTTATVSDILRPACPPPSAARRAELPQLSRSQAVHEADQCNV